MRQGIGVREVANLLCIGENTVRRWVDAGKLTCTRTKGGHRRFDPDYIRRFAREHLAGIDLNDITPDPEPPDGIEL